MARNKFAQSSVDTDTSNGEITFIAARNVKNLNGWTYETSTLQAQDATGEYSALTNDWTEVAIPLMLNHKGDVEEKVGNIYQARLNNVGEEQQVEMKAKWFKGDKAQEARQRVLDGELTDVSITTDWGSGYSDDDDIDTLKNAHIIEVSVVYAGAEPKAKILAKNSVDKENSMDDSVTVIDNKESEDKSEADEDAKVTEEETPAPKEADTEVESTDEEDEAEETEEEAEETEADDSEDKTKEEEELEMATQPTTPAAENVATKQMVLNSLAKLAENGAIRKLNRNQVIEAVKNDIALYEADGTTPYVVPDALFTEILAVTRPTDILETFDTVPVKRFTLMGEVPSDADLARAGRWSKGEQKQIQESDLAAQKFSTQFLYKMQELSYEDLQEDFGDLLYAYIRQELPQKVSEEEERAFIVGDGRATNDSRHISSIVSLDAAAEAAGNVHVAKYDGSNDASAMEAIMKGIEMLQEDGERHLVANGATLGALRRAGLDTNTGLPFSNETVADSLDVDGLHKRSYVDNDVVYVWTRGYVKRLTGGNNGETIEQYDIDYNNHKIEFIRPVGGGASGLYSAVKIVLPATVSA